MNQAYETFINQAYSKQILSNLQHCGCCMKHWNGIFPQHRSYYHRFSESTCARLKQKLAHAKITKSKQSSDLAQWNKKSFKKCGRLVNCLEKAFIEMEIQLLILVNVVANSRQQNQIVKPKNIKDVD